MRFRPIAIAALLVAAPAPATAHAALAYMTGPPGKEHVVLAADDGSARKNLGPGFAPSIAPNAAAVAVYRYGSPRSAPRLHLVAADGTSRLLSTACADMAVWSPDSTRLVCETGGPATRLLLIDVASGRTRVLDRAPSFAGVAFSPSGDQVAWGRQRGSSVAVFDLDVAPVAGGPSRRLLPNGMNPAWGPEFIAVARIRPRGVASYPLFNVWLLRPDGSGLRQLTHRREPQLIGGLVPMQWSADGSRLLGQRSGEDYAEAYRIDPRKGAASDLTGRDDGVMPYGLSADGRAVLATRGGFEPTTGNDVVVIPWAGGRARVLARHAASPSWTR